MRQIRYQLYIAWDFSTYIDESSKLMRAAGEFSLVPPGDGFNSGRGIISSMTLMLNNNDGRYSPLNTSSAIYSSIRDGKAYHAPCYLNVSIDNGGVYTRIFTGVIKWPRPSGASTKEISLIELECRSMEEKYLQSKATTTLSDFQGYYNAGYSESDIIDEWLTNLGVAGGDIVLDPGRMVIPFLWLDDESPIEEIWKLAAACGGRFYADPAGDFVYESATHWLTSANSTTSQETLTADEWERFEMAYEDKDLYSSVLVEASPREILQPDTLWEPDEVITIPANGSRTYTAKLKQPAYSINDVTYVATTAGGTVITSDVTVTQTNYAQRVILEFDNSAPTHAAYLRNFSITGRAVSGAATIEEERNAATHGANGSYYTSRGSRQKSTRGNVYVQSREHAAMIANFLMRQSEYPRIMYRIGGALGSPLRRLGDYITLNDTSLMSGSRGAILTGVRWRLDAKGFKQDLTLIDRENLYPYQDSSPVYFVVGLNYLGSAATDRGRLFF